MKTPAGRWRDDLEAALTEAEDELAKLKPSRPLRRAVLSTTSRARKATRDDALDLVAGFASELDAVRALVNRLYDQGIAAEGKEAADEPFGDAWLGRLRRNLVQDTSAPDWSDRIIDAWSDAIGAQAWETADAVVALASAKPESGVPVKTLVALGAELANQRWDNGIRLIDKLVSDRPLPTATQVRLLVAKARLCLFRVWNPDAALVATEEAGDRATGGPRWSRDLARAATVEALAEVGRLDEANRLVEGVLDRPVGAPDLLVIAGSLHERMGDLLGAEDLYDAAVLRFGDRATAGRLYAPQPQALLWRAAMYAWPHSPDRTVALLDRALELADQDPSPGPERQPWLYRAHVLEQLDRAPDAAAAYHSAARRYDRAGLPALDYYQRAHELAPERRKFALSYAEALRLAATADPSSPDMTALAKARGVLADALDGHVLDVDHAWVLGSSAMIAWELGQDDALLLAERSVVLDPGYARGYGFLAMMLRESGLVGPALDAAEAGYLVDWTDPFVNAQVAYARVGAGVGGSDRAVEVFDYLAYFEPDIDVVVATACVELWEGRAASALSSLAPFHGSGDPSVKLLLAHCHGALDHAEEERELYQALVDSGADRAAGVAGWVSYRLGRYDQALSQLGDGSPDETPSTKMERGQTLVARGSDGDVDDGRACLLDGVAACRDVAQLLHLAAAELVVLLRLVERRQDAPAVSAVRDVVEAARRRIEELREADFPPGSTELALAQARAAARAGRLGEALKHYLVLADRVDLPEIGRRMRSLGAELLELGDKRLLDGDVADATALWQIAGQVPRSHEDVDKLLRKVDVRLGLKGLTFDDRPLEESLERLSRCKGRDLVEVAPRFARDLVTLRRLLAGLEAAVAAGRMPWVGHLVEVRRVVYGALLDPGRAQVDSIAGARHIGAVEIGLGRRLHRAHLDDKSRLGAGIVDLRERLAAETGVQIPGVKISHHPDPDAEDDMALFRVYDRQVGDYRDPWPGDNGVEGILSAFEGVVQHNLFRWLTVDDLFLWCTSWQAGAGAYDDELLTMLPTTPWGKLQLTRLVKMLLREGVPVRDRRAILTAFSTTQVPGGPDVRTVYEALRRGLDTLVEGGEKLALPAPLEERVAAAMSRRDRRSPVWSMRRDDACRLVADLRQLVDTDRTAELVVTVTNPAVRSYVWRLLAADRPRIRVAVEGEGS